MALGGLLALLNWWTVYRTWRSGRFCSAVPFVGAFFLGGGMLLLPQTRPFAWLALVVDYGTLVVFLALPRIADALWKTSRFNLLEEYVGQQANKAVRLLLFRKGVFTIEQQVRRLPGECGFIRTGIVGRWERVEGRLLHFSNGDSAAFEALPGPEYEGLRQASGFRGYWDGELSLAGVELRLTSRRPVTT
jgi:hypothetical protein